MLAWGGPGERKETRRERERERGQRADSLRGDRTERADITIKVQKHYPFSQSLSRCGYQLFFTIFFQVC
jgi:hypothetical protein